MSVLFFHLTFVPFVLQIPMSQNGLHDRIKHLLKQWYAGFPAVPKHDGRRYLFPYVHILASRHHVAGRLARGGCMQSCGSWRLLSPLASSWASAMVSLVHLFATPASAHKDAILPCALPSLHAERTISRLSLMPLRQTLWRTPAFAPCNAHPIRCVHRVNTPLLRLIYYATIRADASVEFILQLLWGTWSIP